MYGDKIILYLQNCTYYAFRNPNENIIIWQAWKSSNKNDKWGIFFQFNYFYVPGKTLLEIGIFAS